MKKLTLFSLVLNLSSMDESKKTLPLEILKKKPGCIELKSPVGSPSRFSPPVFSPSQRFKLQKSASWKEMSEKDKKEENKREIVNANSK